MKTDAILEEVWRVKNKLSREMASDLDAYFARLEERTISEEKAGRKVVRSAGELRMLAAEQERQRASTLAMVLNDNPEVS